MSSYDDDYTEIAGVKLDAVTDGAWLIDAGKLGREWVPRSLIDEDESTVCDRGDEGDVYIRTWKAKELGWE